MQAATQEPPVVDASTLVDEALAHARGERRDRSRWLATGLNDFDGRVGGLAPGSLTVIGGRPGMGKVALANTIAATAIRNDAPGGVLMYSPAETSGKLMIDLLALMAKVRRHRIRDGALEPGDEPHIADAAEQLRRPGRLFIADACGHSFGDLADQARRLASSSDGDGLQLIVVDTLDLLSDAHEPDQRERELGLVVRELKELAVELDVPVLATARVRSEADQRVPPSPRLRDLHAPDAVQRHADIVALLYRPEYYVREDTPIEWQGKAELIVEHNRHGLPGSMILGYLAPYGLFLNMVR
jgi:replicative DNA helicase